MSEPAIDGHLIRVDHIPLDQIPRDDSALSRILYEHLSREEDPYASDDQVSAFNNRI